MKRLWTRFWRFSLYISWLVIWLVFGWFMSAGLKLPQGDLWHCSCNYNNAIIYGFYGSHLENPEACVQRPGSAKSATCCFAVLIPHEKDGSERIYSVQCIPWVVPFFGVFVLVTRWVRTQLHAGSHAGPGPWIGSTWVKEVWHATSDTSPPNRIAHGWKLLHLLKTNRYGQSDHQSLIDCLQYTLSWACTCRKHVPWPFSPVGMYIFDIE